jgi:(4S)-4-hydroxy-5-phosphonooxypentane-2,3-dione isomerase
VFTLFVTVDVRPEKIGEFTEAITANATSSLRDEPGCLVFDVHRDIETPTRFYFYEIYTDEEAFTTGHRGAPHYAQWQAIAKDVLVEGSHRATFAETLHLGSSPGS